MTLLITVNGAESVWMMADRRITRGDAVERDNARKVMPLETTDGVAILGYTGLGVTRFGTEPADWMSAVLRGQPVPLEHSLAILADAAKRGLPSHLSGLPHTIVATGFVGEESRHYTIDLLVPPGKAMAFRYTRHAYNPSPSLSLSFTHPTGIGGSGADWLKRDKRWPRRRRELLRLARACDRGKVSPHAVADYLAAINLWVHEEMKLPGKPPPKVGARSVVVWRHSKQGVHKGGGGQGFYNGVAREQGGPDLLPMIMNGGDVMALLKVEMPWMAEYAKTASEGRSVQEIDMSNANAELARLPGTPDERLR